MKSVLTVDEFCKLVGICRMTFNNWRQQGIAPPLVQINRKQLIRRESLERWLKSHERGDAA